MPTSTIQATADHLNRHAVIYNPQFQSQLRQGLEFERMFTPKACDNTYVSPNVSVGDFVQQYQWKFTPKNDVTFDEVSNKLQKIKVDILFTAEQLEIFWNSWRVEWYEIGKDPIEWSFPRWIYENHILPKVIEEMNLNAWIGQYVAPTDGTPGVSVNSVDGYKKKFTDAIGAGDLTELATGAFSANTMVNQIESWCDAMPVLYRERPGNIYMAPSNADKFWRNYRSLFGTGNGNLGNENNELRIDMTNKKIVKINAMEGSNRIFFFPQQTNNVIWGTRSGYPTYPSIRWEKFERSIKGMCEFYRFYGVEHWDHLFINDQV